MSNVDQIVETIKRSKKAGGITAWQVLEPQDGINVEFPSELHPDIQEILRAKGINSLYSHQLDAWNIIKQGGNPVVVTPTASGKTLCYNLPVLELILRNPSAKALYIYPTKALAQDQAHELTDTVKRLETKILTGTYDGDTPSGARKGIRENASIVLTNPDMLHAGILPHHSRWHRFFRNLSVIVIDEVHHYRGIFGSHLCNVLRRLNRICEFHNTSPQYIMSSATLANPADLAARMIGREVTLVNRSGAPRGKKTFVFYNPPLIDQDSMIRRSYLDETLYFARILITAGIQTIIFTRSRRNVELILRELQRLFKLSAGDTKICGYRGGYLPKERRLIEENLREGNTRCVVATSALELGVDIGDLGACILSGYPGTIASTWQRAGRAGRREANSLAVLVASAAPLDQYMVRNPDYFFGHPSEHGLINPDNLLILLEHIRCAAFELPFSDDELFSNLANTVEFLEYLEEENDLQHTGNRWFYTGGGYPAERVSLRSISGDSIVLVDISEERNKIIGEIDSVTAPLLVHPEAVYMHGGKLFVVEKLDFHVARAEVIPMDLGYFTTPLEISSVTIIEEQQVSDELCPVKFGDVQVITQVIGYKKLKFGSQENLGTGAVNLPEQELLTTSIWSRIPLDIADTTGIAVVKDLAAGFVGALTALHSISCVLLMCDAGDIGSCVSCNSGDWTARVDHLGMIQLTGSPDVSAGMVELFIYDRYPGGIGLSENLFRIFPDVVSKALEMTETCECRYGCPGCIGPINVENFDVKYSALSVLRFMAGRRG